jgi:hypothetical protein
MYKRWNKILIRADRKKPDAISYVTRSVNRKTSRYHHGGVQERVLGNPQSSIVADSGDDGDDKNDWEPVIPAARIGHTTAAEVILELTQRDVEAIIGDLVAWGDDRTAHLLPIFLDEKLTLENASRWDSLNAFKADYAFFVYQMKNASSKLQRAIRKRKSNVIELPVAERTAKKKRSRYYPLRNPHVLGSREVTYTLVPVSRYKLGDKPECIEPWAADEHSIIDLSDTLPAYSLAICNKDGRRKAETIYP